MKRTYVFRDGEFVEVTSNFVRRTQPNYGIITDTMNPTWHPADGKTYDSKSAFRRATRENGCEELGNDMNKPERKGLSDPTPELERAWNYHVNKN